MSATVLVTEKTKNGTRLVWPLEGWAREYVEARVKECRFPGDYLFPGPEGAGAYTAIKRSLKGVIEAAKLTYGRKDPAGITFHTFRHSMAWLALNARIPESSVQKMGNWKTRIMVARYAHLADETLRSASGRMDAIVSRVSAVRRDCVELPSPRKRSESLRSLKTSVAAGFMDGAQGRN